MKFSHRIALTAAITAAIVTLSGCGGASSTQEGAAGAVADGDPITIGVSTVATGPLAINDQCTQAMAAYFDWRNANGGIAGHDVELKVVDSAGTVAGGATTARTLLADDPFGIFVLSTAPFTGAQTVLKTAPETPVFVLANGSVVRAAELPNAFGMFTDYTTESFVGVEYMAELGAKKIALIYDPTIGEDAANKAPAVAEKLGAEIIPVPVPATTSNFDPIVQKLRDSGAEGIVFQVVAQSIAGTLKAAERTGLDLPSISYSGQLNATTLELGGSALEGMYFSGLFPLLSNPKPEVQEFVTEIQKSAPDAATVLGELGWNTGAMIAKAIEDASASGDLTRESFMAALRKLGGQAVGVLDKVGWTDEVTSSIDAGNTDVFTIYQVKNGEFVEVVKK